MQSTFLKWLKMVVKKKRQLKTPMCELSLCKTKTETTKKKKFHKSD